MTKIVFRKVLTALLLCAALCLSLSATTYAAGGGGYGGSGYVSFDSNGGSGWMNGFYPDTQPWYVPDSEFTRAGQSFTGWGLAAEGPVDYRPGDRAYSNSDMTLYAQWRPMTQAELAARYTPQVYEPYSWNINATVDEQTGISYMTAKLGWSQIKDVQDFTITLNLGSPDGPRVPALATSFSTQDGSVTTSWSTSYATVAVPFLAEGEEQTVTDGAVNGVLDGDVVFATVASHFDAGDCPGNPVFFACKLPNTGPAVVDEVSWFASSGNGTVASNEYGGVVITLTEDTELPEDGLTLGNNTYHINMNTHSLTGTLNNGWGEVYIEHLTGDGPVLACYGWNQQTLTFNNYVYLNGSGLHEGSVTVTLSDYAGFDYDSGYMTATVTNGAYVGEEDVSTWGYVNTQPLARYEVAELDEDALEAYTPKNVTVTPQEDGLIVECDYEPDARTININVDVLLADGSAARVISDTSSSSKDQVMKLEGDRQSFFIAARCLSDEEEQQISEDGAQKIINGYKGGDRLSVTMNFEVGRYSQATPWSDPPVTFTYSSGAIGATFAQGDNVTVARNFLPEIATIAVTSPLEVTYSGEWQTLDYTVTLNGSGTVLTPGVDYTEEYINNVRPGEATLAVIGQGAYSGRMTQPFTINGIDLASEAVTATLAFDSTVYNGSSQTPAVLVACDGRIMEESSEYYTEYSDNVNAGTATLTLTPGHSGTTSGTRTVEFTITPRSLESDALYATLTQNRFAVTGAAIEPTLASVKWGDRALTEGTDYSVSYLNNTAPGTGSVVLTGMGNYAGTRSLDFTIYAPVDLSTAAVVEPIEDQTYTGSALTPAVTVKVGEQTLTEGWDYTVAYANNTNAGEATVTVTGRGDYTGTATAAFTVAPAELSQCEATLYKANSYGSNIGEAVYDYSGVENKPSATVTFNGRTLYENTSYTLSYRNNVNAGTATAVLTGTGNFTGTLELPFTVNPLNLDDLDSASAADAVYNAAPQTPKITMYTQYWDGDGYSKYNYLTADRDYDILGWADNVNAGTASVTVKGKGNYTGQRAINFTINPMPMYQNDFTVSYDKYVTYTGNPVNPIRSVVWKITGETLVEGRDYTIGYSNGNYDLPDNENYDNHTEVCNGIEARLAFTGNFSGSGYYYYFNIVAAPEAFDGISGNYQGTLWSINAEGTLTVRTTGALADLSYHNDVAWRPYRQHIRKIVVSQGVTSLTAGAFQDCPYVTEVVLPEGLTTINYSVFSGCDSLQTINIPDSVTMLASSAIPDVLGLEVHLPDNITDFDGNYAFQGASDKTKVFVTRNSATAQKLIDTNGYFFYEGHPDFLLMKSFNSPEKGLQLYRYCGSGGTVTVPDFVDSVYGYGFSDTYRIEKVVIPPNVSSLGGGGMSPFTYSYGLREIVIQPGNKLTELPYQFITGCNDITLYIPDNIQYCPNPINYYMNNDMLIVANCNAPVIESAKGQYSWNSPVWRDENEASSGPRYRLIHDLVHHDGQAPTCENDGWAPYDTCKNCDYTTYTAIPALGHDWGAAAYEWNADHTKLTATRVCQNDNAHIETETVDVTAEIILAPTCTEMGQTTYTSAAFENQAFTAQAVTLTDISALGHDWNTAAYDWNAAHTAVTATHVCRRDESHVETETVSATSQVTTPATCTAMGNTTYTSAAFTVPEFSVQALTLTDIPSLGHDWGAPTYVGSADHSRLTATRICARDTGHVETETVSAAFVISLPATCTEMGQTTYTPSAFENPAFSVQTVTLTDIPALGHAWGAVDYEWNADHTKLTATRVCANDESHVETETVGATSQVTTPATCTEMGRTTYTSAAFENSAFSAQTVTLTDIPALGHDWSAAAYEWNADHSKLTATRICAHDASHVETETVNAASAVTLAPACETMGKTTYTSAAFTNTAFEAQTITLTDIDPLGHDWGEPTYIWNDDHSKLTATRVCKRDADHVESETVSATAEITLPATCTEQGQTTYTSAAFTNPAFEAQTVTLTDIDPLGHDWGTPTYVWNGDHSKLTATRVCERDGSHSETETVNAASAVTLAPACETMGKTTYTSAAFTNPAFETQVVTLTDIDPLGHDWGEPIYTWNKIHTRLTARHICNRDASHAESETVAASAAVSLPATCTEQGKTTYTSAAFANSAFAAQSAELTDIPALGHDWLDETYSWNADHTQLTARHVCARSAAHTEEETVGVTSRIIEAAGCLTSGKTAYLSDAFENPYFESQSVTLSDIPALGHAWGEPRYDWSGDHGSLTATRVCGNDAAHTETETVSAAAEIISPASCETEGMTAYLSESFENPAFEAQTVTLTNIPALGHDWQNPVYAWSADHTQLTAKRICRHDTSHVETETVGATAQITREPDCTVPGQTTYTSAAFTNPAFLARSLTQSNLPALGHDWQPETYKWTNDFSQLTAARVCRHDASHTESETVTVSAEITRPASCTARGRTTYTSAAFANPAFSVHTITLANIPKLDHNWAQAPSTAATDTAVGVRGGTVCSACGAVLREAASVSAQRILRIPAMMEEIGEEAFMGVAAQQITIPAGTRSIGSKAFADCDDLLIAVIPSTVSEIANDAFDGSDVTVICPNGCYAADWCEEHRIPHNP